MKICTEKILKFTSLNYYEFNYKLHSLNSLNKVNFDSTCTSFADLNIVELYTNFFLTFLNMEYHQQDKTAVLIY